MNKMLFRNATKNDLQNIYHLAEQGGYGLTTLPQDMTLLKKRLSWSIASFSKKITHPTHEYYLFVLEDLSKEQVVGTSAIESTIGHEIPFYSYKLSKRTRVCHSLNIRTDYEVLSLVNDNQGASEICTLFLEPSYRHSGNGLLLSRARFLFIAQFPQRFSSTIIAEMRGISDESGHSPFWDAVGNHFFHMPFTEADRFTISTNKQFIADLMPRNPIYIKLLDTKAQEVIGQPHPSTVPAMNILLHEGFRYNRYIDIFDAGPTLEAPKERIKTIETSHVVLVKNIIDEVSGQSFIISNTKLNFRATVCQAILNPLHKYCIITKEVADLLHVTRNDFIRIAPLKF